MRAIYLGRFLFFLIFFLGIYTFLLLLYPMPLLCTKTPTPIWVFFSFHSQCTLKSNQPRGLITCIQIIVNHLFIATTLRLPITFLMVRRLVTDKQKLRDRLQARNCERRLVINPNYVSMTVLAVIL